MAGKGATIRAARTDDLSRLVDIYNHYVTNTHVTFDTEAFAIGARTQWFTQFSEEGPHRLFVVEEDDTVAGYASSTPFKNRPAYGTSVETTIYLDPERTGRGLGIQLYGALVDALIQEESVHRAYGGVALPNPESVAVHEALGFRQVAMFSEVGFKFGKYWDVAWFEKEV